MRTHPHELGRADPVRSTRTTGTTGTTGERLSCCCETLPLSITVDPPARGRGGVQRNGRTLVKRLGLRPGLPPPRPS